MSERGESESPGIPVGSNRMRGRAFWFGRASRRVSVIGVSCGVAVLVWVWQTVGDQEHREALTAARQLRVAVRPTDRVNAMRDLVRLAANDGGLTIPALVRCLNDTDESVRVEAVRALWPVTSGSARLGTDDALVESAIEALLQATGDPAPDVRAAAVIGLGSIAIPESLSTVNRGAQKARD